MNRSTPGLPVHHQLPEFTQTHVHWVSDAIQPSHPLLSPSPPAPNPSQHQSLFQWVNSSHEVAQVLEFQLQHQSFQWIFRTDLLKDGLVVSPCSPRDSQESSPTPQCKSINSSALSFLYGPTFTSMWWSKYGTKTLCDFVNFEPGYNAKPLGCVDCTCISNQQLKILYKSIGWCSMTSSPNKED